MTVCIDSRNLTDPLNTVFYALKGVNHNGHDYVVNLYGKGVRHFVLEEKRVEFDMLTEAVIDYVPSTLLALQNAAAEYRSHCMAEVTAITGSNGKTVVKEWIARLTGDDVPLSRSPRSYNSQVGVPLSLLAIRPDAQVALIEAGISLPGEMSRLQQMIRPQIGVFTHLGEAHGENFASLEEKMREKALLFRGCRTVICREGSAAGIIRETVASDGCELYLWGNSPEASMKVTDMGVAGKGRDVYIEAIRADGLPEKGVLHLPFKDDAAFENCMTAVAFMLCHNYSLDQLRPRVADLQPVSMRMEIREGTGGSTLLKDYYNSDPESFMLALRALSQQDSTRPRAVILSDFMELGDSPQAVYAEVARKLKDAEIRRFVGVGPCLKSYRTYFNLPQTAFYDTTEEFLKNEHREDWRGMNVLIKGARRFSFEYVGNFLSKQSHTTVLEVDLDALTRNFNLLRSRVPQGTLCGVMVKAFSYGIGAAEVAAQLQLCGADYLMVAYADEGVQLRSGGITLPIAVMNPEVEAFDQMLEFSLEPEIYSLSILKDFINALQNAGMQDYPVHVKLNTGMNRSGLDAGDIPGLTDLVTSCNAVRIKSLFSHLAAADDPQEDEFTLGQIALFERLSSEIQGHFPYRILRHILNSAGIERFPQYAFDMVRMGISLYGVSTLKGIETVSTFKTHIASIRKVAPGATVGYGRRGKVSRPSEIAVIPVGYADGIDRHLSCGVGQMLVRGRRVPVIGTVCMDTCMLDVTGLGAEVGDEVEIFGRNLPLAELSGKLDTIPYEVLTGISQRVRRVYYKE